MNIRSGFAQRLTATRRFALAVTAAVCAYAAQAPFAAASAGFLVAWDVGATVYLVLAWTTIVCSGPQETRLHARSQDLAAYFIFVAVLIAAFASVAAITLLLSGL